MLTKVLLAHSMALRIATETVNWLKASWQGGELLSSVRNLFVSIYFSHFELFLLMNTHSPNTCSHLRYALTTCSLPFISFHFHHSHQVQTIANTSKVNSNI